MDDKRWNSLRNEISNLLKTNKSKIPGAIYAILTENGKYFGSYGFSDIELKKSISSKTIFRVASITKLFTTIAIMQLYEKGLIEINGKVNDYLPENLGKLIGKRKDRKEVTILHLLTHQSGIGELPKKSYALKLPGFGLNIKWPKDLPPMQSLMKKDITPEVEPELKYAYCNFAYHILGIIIEHLSGMSYRDYIKKYILDPLEMNNSDIFRTEKIKALESTGYYLTFMTKRLKKAPYFQSIMQSAAGLYTTAEDLLKFGKMLLNGGVYNGKRIIGEKSLKQCWTPHYFAHKYLKDVHSIGYTFHIYMPYGIKVIGHTGLFYGHTSAFYIIPKRKACVLVLTNLGEIFHNDCTQKLAHMIIRNLLNQGRSGKDNDGEISIPEIEIGSSKKVSDTPANFDDFKGIYAPYRGILTNFRILQIGAEFKLYRDKKSGNPKLKSLYGQLHKGITLTPTQNPNIFVYRVKNYGFIHTHNMIVLDYRKFGSKKQKKRLHLHWNLYRLPKKEFWKTLRFKIWAVIIISIAAIISALIL